MTANLAVSKPAACLSSFRCILGDVLFISDIANGITEFPCFVLQHLIGFYNMDMLFFIFILEEYYYNSDWK